MQQQYLSMRDAAAVLGVHYATIRYWVRTGKLPTYGIGTIRRVRIADLTPQAPPPSYASGSRKRASAENAWRSSAAARQQQRKP